MSSNEQNLQVCNRVLQKRVLWPKREDESGDWRKIQNEEHHGLFSSLIVWMEKITDEMGEACISKRERIQSFVKEIERKETAWENLGFNGMIKIKHVSKKLRAFGLDLFGSEQEPVATS
jgi:hypothetical protein